MRYRSIDPEEWNVGAKKEVTWGYLVMLEAIEMGFFLENKE